MAVRMLRSSLMLRSLFFLLLLLWNLNAAHAARGFRHNTRHGQSALYGTNKSLKNSGLFPSTFNVAAKADIFVNATCGEEGPETFCKPSESSRCAVCDARSPDPGKKHNISNILDSSPGKWWQSPTLARGEHYEYVTIALDLKQVYQIEYVIVKAANSPRPAAWILEKSIDGENFQPWQYYAPSDEECWTRYSVPPVTGKPIYIGDDDVICTSVFSRQTPMENGEIHTHLVNGRPGALNHSTTLQEFTQARYVRLRLQGLRRSGETIADKRRAFYSIKEINIGGRCVCSGHAARCRYSVQHGHQECECERHTCGERCEKCCPMYNQIPWKPGTAAKGFHCEKCNCNGHATSCRYDQDVADRRMSMDIRGKFRGGGVCINCTEHTAGINCEKCQVNYYRPNGVAPDDPEPCVPCDCNVHGSTGYCTPDDSYVHMGKVAGACDCKPGYSGYKCDQCAAGYRQFPDCMPCPCDSRGILPSHDCEGDCLCKANVAGELCDQCKPGHFALTKENLDGCLPCYCFGVSDHCGTAKLSYSTISSLENWLVTDVNATRAIVPILDTDNGWLTIAAFDVEYDSPFWLAPRIYCGNRLSSYGSNLTYSVSWVVMRGDTSGRPTTGPNVVLVGNNGMRIAYGEEQYNGQEAEITVPLREDGWYHVRGEIQDIPTRLRRTEFRGDAVTRIQMMKVLADLKYLMIRAQYHSEQIEGSLQSAVVSVGDISSSGENNNLVEKCECPEGYTGLSCENCAWGYVKLIQNGSDHQNHHVCVKCDCNGHASTCDLVLGECTTCEHNTVGPKCDRCAPGFYGIALTGTSDDCKRCACPLLIETNNFSPNCQLDDPTDIDSGYVCTQCPKGYTGDHCESCDIGFFGNPLIPGGTCEPCFCGGGPCDQETGRCLECRGNTEGWKCDKCKPAHYGNPLEQNCLPCNCDPLGTSSIECDEKSGQCPCKPLFEGRDCSSCIEGYGNVTAGCRECDCDVGALDEICDPVTGECRCTEGVLGFRCDHCDIDHYGLSTEGCNGCRCNPIGSITTACDIVTGQCQCKPHVTGRQCDQCMIGFWGLPTGAGCAPCGCDPIGAYNSSCHDSMGQCYCKPGVGGTRCDVCLPGYYGYSSNGCQVCDSCVRPGHVCDPDTGRCVCPTLTFGEHCDRCRSGSWDLVPGVGCRPCACTLGSMKPQCDHQGQCPCRIGYDGLRCEKCAKGYYGYPRCRPCSCNVAGTLQCDDETCDCNDKGQCPCKEYVVGRQCSQCKEGTFGLALDNPKGCTECFCFGRTTSCQQAGLSWGQRRLTRPRTLYVNDTINDIIVSKFRSRVFLSPINGGLNMTNGLSTIPDTGGDVTIPSHLYYNYPLYWMLPESFLGDKVVSYGGFLRFTTSTEGGIPLRSTFQYPIVQLQGNRKIVLEYYLPVPSDSNHYEVRFHESLWQLQNRPDYKVTREVLMVALQNLQYILVKASDNAEFTRTTLHEASIDAAVLTPMHIPQLATGVEICKCPPKYNSTSCQDPSIGHYRWYNNTTVTSTIVINLIGEAIPCQCNGRSDICDIETGHCLNCRENTAGPRCDICSDSFYGHPDFGCKPCPCPQADKRFSNTCMVLANTEAICVCKPGYTGRKCERCSSGYYGFPHLPGGKCIPCNCNPAGSLNDECDTETGQCRCRAGSTGRDCSECTAYRHVYINNVCTSCNDNCTGILLDTVAALSQELAESTTHIANGYIPPPWEDLSYIDSNITTFLDEINLRNRLRQRMRDVPWHEYRNLMKYLEMLLRTANERALRADTVKSKTSDLENNIFSAKIEAENLRKYIEDTITLLNQYTNENKRVEIKKALNTAKMILNGIKELNLAKKTMEIERFLEDVAEYTDWLNSLYDATGPLATAQNNAEEYSIKLTDMRNIIENTMETLFTYDGLYNNINQTYQEAKNYCSEIDMLRSTINASLTEGEKLIDETRSFIVNFQNNVQDLPELRNKLTYWFDKLSMKEELLYRLNYEYNDTYVIPAIAHVKNLSNYVDQYVSLFSETKNIAASPLKASQAYKNIVDNIRTANITATAAKDISEDTYNKIFPDGPKSQSLLDSAKEILLASSKQQNSANRHGKLVQNASDGLELQKEAVNILKNTLNSTGIRDNQVNIKLQTLQDDSKKLRENVENILNDNEKVLESIKTSQKLIGDYKEGIANILKPKLYDLKREGDSEISLASEKLTEALSNMKKADAKLISLSNAAVKRKNEFDKWNDTLTTKLQNLKDKIAEARNTADGIRVSLKSAEGKECSRSYRPPTLQPSSMNSIIMTFALPKGKKEGPLFYLPSSINDDFLALEIIDRRVRFMWNVGGGTGILTHPEVIQSGDLLDDRFWYRIEAERVRHLGKLYVRKQASTTKEHPPIKNSTDSEYGRFDITSSDRVWIGKIPITERRRTELIASNGLPACVHQVILDGKPIGLWNFITTAPDMACEACVEGVEDVKDDIAYSFNGEGYAVRNRVSSGPYNKYSFGVSISFRTYDENALLFLAINPDNNQHIMIFLREGKVILHIGYGGNVSMEMSSNFKYNNGNWTKVDAFRYYQLRKTVEKCSLSVGGENDKRIGAPTPQPKKEDIPDFIQAKYYIGGVPPSFRAEKLILPSQVSFFGCMSNIIVEEGYDPMAEQYHGVEPTCANKPLRIVGFYGDGYLQHVSYTLRKINSTMSFSFRTMQENAVLLLSTFEGQEERMPPIRHMNDDSIKKSYYSICIINGQVQVRLNAGRGELTLQSNDTFNDGRYHSVTVIKRRKDIELRIDDAYQSAGKLPTSAAIKAPEESGGLFFGGLPVLINNTNMISTTTPLYGTIKDAIFNDDIVRFDEAISFEHALIGRSGPSMGKDPPTYTPSASLSRGMSTQPEGCQKVPYYSLEAGALKFGDKPNSHTQLYLNFKKFWEKKYAIEFDFRTYYPNGLLFITPGLRPKHYLMVVIRDGQLLLLVKSKQKKEILFKTPFNDGNWHHVVISHDERKLTLLVDSQTPRTIKVPRKIGLASMMYIGGLPESGTPIPEQVVVKLETLKGCIRGLRINGNVYDMVGSTSRAYQVGQCFPNVESGAYFQDEAYAIYKRNFELGAVLELQLEFRTSELSGVLLSITAPGNSPSLSLELNNGKVIMSGDLGDNNPLYVEQRFNSPYTICDNRWHRIQAVYNDEELALKVDELDQKYGLPANVNYHIMDATVSRPLYIGGLPASAPKGTLITRDHFNGCIRNVMIGGERRDWTDMDELHNIHLSSCPVQ
ncbi:laminin subunit alpha-1 isoform X2 [Bombus huntii]|uniref:laminin subunit alpha-1 isoform X2 n=2 Tax=Bombus huntii TaxID=85661 RepID=UPI0021A9C383|nr:laminin subunit alpha-1 isoform X2 [Bombus huntii]